MSVEAMVWAKEMAGLRPHEKLLLILLSDGYHPGNQPPDCPLPDSDWMLKQSGLTETQYAEALCNLRARGLVRFDHQALSYRLMMNGAHREH